MTPQKASESGPAHHVMQASSSKRAEGLSAGSKADEKGIAAIAKQKQYLLRNAWKIVTIG